MDVEYIKPSELIPYNKNAKRHPSVQVKQFGFAHLVIDGFGFDVV